MMMEEDGEDELPEKYEMLALKQVLCGDIRKHINLKEQDILRDKERYHYVGSE